MRTENEPTDRLMRERAMQVQTMKVVQTNTFSEHTEKSKQCEYMYRECE